MNSDRADDVVSRIYSIADELRAVANLGLRYSKSEYDRERWDKVLATSARLAGLMDNKPSLTDERAC